MLGLKIHKKDFYQDIYHFLISSIDDSGIIKDFYRKKVHDILINCEMTDRNNVFFRSALAPQKKDQESIVCGINKSIKDILMKSAYQDIKWTFAGTSLSMTNITKDNLGNNSILYDDLLPAVLKNKNKKKTNDKIVCIYPDGSCSYGKYMKVKITYKNLEDNSGFDWCKGYSFENKVKNKKWNAGFNHKGIWEMKKFNHNFLLKPDRMHEYDINDEDFIFLITGTDERNEEDVILFDGNGFLLNKNEKKFYDEAHDIGKAGKNDIDKTLDSIKDVLKKRGIKKITKVVAETIDKKNIRQYKKLLKDVLCNEIIFYKKGDPEINLVLNNKMSDYKNNIIGQKNSFDIIKNKKVLNDFLKSTAVDKKISLKEKNQVEKVINDLKIPLLKSKKISQIIQNILIKDKSFFKKINLSKIEFINMVQKAFSQKGLNNQFKFKYKTNLYDLIENKNISLSINSKGADDFILKSKDFNSFESLNILFKDNKVFKKTDKSFFSDLLKKIDLMPETKRMVFIKKIRTAFDNFSSMGEMPDIKPLELNEAVYNIILKKNIGLYKKKELTFEKNVKDLLMDFSGEATHFSNNTGKMGKSDIFFHMTDISNLEKSRVFRRLKPQKRKMIIKYIKKNEISSDKRDNINYMLMKILNEHHDNDNLTVKIEKLKKYILKNNKRIIPDNQNQYNIIKIPCCYSNEYEVKKNDKLLNSEKLLLIESDLNDLYQFNYKDKSNDFFINKLNKTFNYDNNQKKVIKKIYLNENDDINYSFKNNNLRVKNESITDMNIDYDSLIDYNIKKSNMDFVSYNENIKNNLKHFDTAQINYYEDKKKISIENDKIETNLDRNLMLNDPNEIDMTVEDILTIIKRELSDEL